MGGLQSYLIGSLLVSIALIGMFGFYTNASITQGTYNQTGVVATKIKGLNDTLTYTMNKTAEDTLTMKLGINSNETLGPLTGIITFIDLPFQVVGAVYNVVLLIFKSFNNGFDLIGATLGFGIPILEQFIVTGMQAIVGIFVLFTFLNFIHARKPI